MKYTIHKFRLLVNDIQSIIIPGWIRLLSVDAQFGGLYVWALVDPLSPLKTNIKFFIAGTGNPFEANDLDEFDFWRTVQVEQPHVIPGVPEPPLVWHVFVEKGALAR